MCENNALRSRAAKPQEALAAKYCAVTDAASPNSPSSSRMPHWCRM